jgi:hypothetical protein
METKLHAYMFDRLKIQLGFKSVFVVDSVGKNGGLALLWNDDIVINIQNYSKRHINAVVKLDINSQPWTSIGFYEHRDVTKCKVAWSLLHHLQREKHGAHRRPGWEMEDFQTTLEYCQLHDMNFLGPKFTWSNKRDGTHFIQERVDRGTANAK